MENISQSRYRPIKFAKFHTPLFLAGTNLGEKVDLKHRHDVSMAWDTQERFLIIWLKDECTELPEANIAQMIPSIMRILPDFLKRDVPPLKPVPPVVHKAVSAQVETPHSHVFAGPGGGKTGK